MSLNLSSNSFRAVTDAVGTLNLCAVSGIIMYIHKDKMLL